MPTPSIRRLQNASLVALLASASLGCVLSQATDGTSISDEQIAVIQPGTSTRADVVRVLGAPEKVIYSNFEHDPLFERAFQYKRTRRKSTFFTLILFSGSRSDTNVDNLIVFFDDKGVVEDVAARLDMDRPRFAWPWSEDDG
jgi:outer membrane protein assembly factor BamE (lipoprotein component of BamABCDE complex)